MGPKELAFTRLSIRQLAGLDAAARVSIFAALGEFAGGDESGLARVEPSRAPPIQWLGMREGWLALVEGDERVVVLRLGAEADAAIAALRALATGRDERVERRAAERLLAGGNAVKVWREQRKLTQAQLAKRADIHPDYLSHIETGRQVPRDQVLSSLARALAIDALDVGLLVEVPRKPKRKARR